MRQEGAEVDAKTTTGVTALWLAAGEGRKAVAADLIAKGADVNNRRTDGITAVMAAAVGGHKVSIFYLSIYLSYGCMMQQRLVLCVGRAACSEGDRIEWQTMTQSSIVFHIQTMYLAVTSIRLSCRSRTAHSSNLSGHESPGCRGF